MPSWGHGALILSCNEDFIMTFTIINLEQGTPEWLQWRKTGITASDWRVPLQNPVAGLG